MSKTSKKFYAAVHKANATALLNIAPELLKLNPKSLDYDYLAKSVVVLANAKHFREALLFANKALDVDHARIEVPELVFWIYINTQKYQDADDALTLLKAHPEAKARESNYLDWEIMLANALFDLDRVVRLFEVRGSPPSKSDVRFSELSAAFVRSVGIASPSSVDEWLEGVNVEHLIQSPYGLDAYTTYLVQNGRPQQAIEMLKAALLGPMKGHAELDWNLALLQISAGDSEGWIRWLNRWESTLFPSPLRTFDMPRWNGSDSIRGKQVLIWGEQGLGDEIKFLTMLPPLLSLEPSEVTLEVNKKITGLVRTWFPECIVRESGANDCKGHPEYAKFDYQMPIGDLPSRFYNYADRTKRYLDLAEFGDQLKEKLRLKFGNQKPIIGISWRSNKLTIKRNAVYVSMSWVLDLVRQFEGELNFVSLQVNLSDQEREEILNSSNIIEPEVDFFNEVFEQAKYIAACDLVVTAPTSVGQIAGAVMTPTITWLEKNHPQLEGGNHRFWFDTVHYIRTERSFDRGSLLLKVSRLLKKIL